MGMPDMPVSDKKDYEAERALDIIVEAEKIGKDEKLMSRVGQVATEQAIAANRVAQKYGSDLAPTERHPDRDRERTEF